MGSEPLAFMLFKGQLYNKSYFCKIMCVHMYVIMPKGIFLKEKSPELQKWLL